MNVLLLLVLASASPADDFRKTQPSPLPSSTFTVPPVQTGVVPGTRLEIVLVEDHALPAVQLRMVFPSGSLLDPPEKAGLTGLCTRLANEGTERLTKVQWETALADLAASVELGGGAEQSSLSLRSLKETWPGTLDLALELVAHPGLRDDDLKRVRDRALAQLAQAKGSAAGLAARLQSRVAWGANHPMGALATEKSLAAIGVADCQKVLARLRPDGARVFVAGDVTLAEVTAALGARLTAQGFRGTAAKAPKMPAPRTDSAVDRAPVVLVNVPGAEQSVVTIVAAGPPRQAKDHDATSVMAAVLGGGFSSRINMNLREKNGFTYGARGGFSYWKDRSLFTVSSSVRTDATGPALKEIAAELKSIVATPITDVELGRERDGSLLAFPASFATSSSTLDTWSNVFFYGLPKDTLDKTPARLAALKKSDMEKVAKMRVPQNLRVFVVGDAARIAADLDGIAAANLFGKKGKVVVLDADGVIVESGAVTPK